MRQDIFTHLRNTSYPGRGILLGKSADGNRGIIAYFIMGRSENSRNRVFELTQDGFRTKVFDESLVVDPTLIIYHPLRRLADGAIVVTNGDQTETLVSMLKTGSPAYAGLLMRTFEPDEPNWTPRISGVLYPDGNYELSILKATDGDPAGCTRALFMYENPFPGTGHFISTYSGDGTPLPSYEGEPILADIPQESAGELAEALWAVLDPDNRVSLYTAFVDLQGKDGTPAPASGGRPTVDEVIINAHEKQ